MGGIGPILKAVKAGIRWIGANAIKGNTIGDPLMSKVIKGKMSIFDAQKQYFSKIKNIATNDKTRILPENTIPAMRKYWQTHSGDKFKWKDFLLKEGKALEWLVPGGLVFCEAGNIYRAFTDDYGGVKEGTSETCKTAARVTAGTIGSILGTAIPIPVLGSIIGYMAGDWLATFATGDTHDERVEKFKSTEPGKALANARAQNTQRATGTGSSGSSRSGNQNVSFNGNVDLNALASDFANQYSVLSSYGMNGYSGLNSFNNEYSTDFLTQSIFGNSINNSGFSNPNGNFGLTG